MRKLTLTLDALQVESFEMAKEGLRHGTVVAHRELTVSWDCYTRDASCRECVVTEMYTCGRTCGCESRDYCPDPTTGDTCAK
ncbi:MAG TPA: hypothetical protein VK358_05960 [Longimicrobium sp.]|nr:hypothetical protein [Longimicrobium sp.]